MTGCLLLFICLFQTRCPQFPDPENLRMYMDDFLDRTLFTDARLLMAPLQVIIIIKKPLCLQFFSMHISLVCMAVFCILPMGPDRPSLQPEPIKFQIYGSPEWIYIGCAHCELRGIREKMPPNVQENVLALSLTRSQLPKRDVWWTGRWEHGAGDHSSHQVPARTIHGVGARLQSIQSGLLVHNGHITSALPCHCHRLLEQSLECPQHMECSRRDRWAVTVSSVQQARTLRAVAYVLLTSRHHLHRGRADWCGNKLAFTVIHALVLAWHDVYNFWIQSR